MKIHECVDDECNCWTQGKIDGLEHALLSLRGMAFEAAKEDIMKNLRVLKKSLKKEAGKPNDE